MNEPSGAQPPGPDAPDATTGSKSLGADVPETAMPPVWARVLAFVSILLGGACGGFIGYAFGSLGGFSDIATGVIALVVGLGLAGGVAVIAVLTLRALGEWETIRAQGPEAVRAARSARAARGKS